MARYEDEFLRQNPEIAQALREDGAVDSDEVLVLRPGCLKATSIKNLENVAKATRNKLSHLFSQATKGKTFGMLFEMAEPLISNETERKMVDEAKAELADAEAKSMEYITICTFALEGLRAEFERRGVPWPIDDLLTPEEMGEANKPVAGVEPKWNPFERGSN